jgi:hypothetical protein
MSASLGVAELDCLVSVAHCCLAPSIFRKLLMHAFFCAVVRALTKFGIAMAARSPIIATTIMISTSVKAALADMFIFIGLSFALKRREQGRRLL